MLDMTLKNLERQRDRDRVRKGVGRRDASRAFKTSLNSLNGILIK